MAMPCALLQKCCSYLPRAEAGGEPAVLPFLFLLHRPEMLELGLWEASEWSANSCSVWQLLGRADGNLQWLQERCCLKRSESVRLTARRERSPAGTTLPSHGWVIWGAEPLQGNGECFEVPFLFWMSWRDTEGTQRFPALYFSCMKTQH